MTSPIKPPQEIVSTITKIAPKIYDMTVVSTSEEGSAALISRNAKAGQFVMIRADEEGERIPLTIAQTEAKKRAVRLIFQVVGTSTHKLSLLKPGDQVLNLAGPLGKPSEVVEGKKVLVIGGGVGIAAILPIAGSLYHAGNDVTVVLGARTRDLLILKDEFKPIAHRLVLCTDDGSEGRKGFVTDAMNDLVAGQVDAIPASQALHASRSSKTGPAPSPSPRTVRTTQSGIGPRVLYRSGARAT